MALVAPTCSPLAMPYKDAGNAAFASGRFQEAVEQYSQAILADPSSALLRSNRAGAYASLGRHVDALADADMCCSLRPDWWKSYTRRGHALFQLGRFDDAEACFLEAQTLNPDDKTIAEALDRARQRKQGGGSSGSASAGPRAAAASNAPPAAAPAFPGESARSGPTTAQQTSLPTDFQKLSQEDVRKHLEESLLKLTDSQLDAELKHAGISWHPSATRADKVHLYLQVDGLPTGVALPKPAEKKKPPFMSRFSKGDQSGRGEQFMETRKKWIEEWNTWDDAMLLQRLLKLGIDAEGNPRAVLIDLLLEEETKRYNEQRCTPKRLQFLGIACASASIMGTFGIVALVFAVG
mmetsp:Transcript_34672/g.62932  ORF Transcript_34672/g.62932 Transcript_34672/m.62932 type:complete len:351 (+) Transcript_34672:65-1117(+)